MIDTAHTTACQELTVLPGLKSATRRESPRDTASPRTHLQMVISRSKCHSYTRWIRDSESETCAVTRSINSRMEMSRMIYLSLIETAGV